LVIPAEQSGDEFILECLLEAIGQRLENCAFKEWACDVAQFGLLASNVCLTRAGITRRTRPDHSQQINWPKTDARLLEKCVSLDLGQLKEMRCFANGTEALAFQFGSFDTTYKRFLGNPLYRRPFAFTEHELIVVSPMTVTNAIRDAILERAVAEGRAEELAGRFHRTVANRVTGFCSAMGWENKVSDTFPVGDVVVDEAVYSFDENKIAVTYIVIDNLSHGTLFSGDDHYWDTDTALAAIKERAEHNQRQLTSHFPAHYEILHCIVIQGIGRPHSYSITEIPDPQTYSVTTTAGDLHVFAMLNYSDSLALWRTAVGLKRVPGTTGMSFYSFLDHYAIFRSRSDSYYFGDDGIPDFIFCGGAGMNLRLELADNLDPHLVVEPDGKRFSTVYRIENEKPNFEVFKRIRHHVPERYVDGWPNPVWVRAKHEESFGHFHLIDAVAFWLWKLTPVAVSSAVKQEPSQVINFLIEAKGIETAVPGESSSGSGVTVSLEQESTVNIVFDADFVLLSMGKDNQAELNLLRQLLDAVLQIYGTSWSSHQIDEFIEEFGMNPKMKRIRFADGINASIQDTNGLPLACIVESFDQQLIQDELSEHLEISNAINEGRLDDKHRNKVLNQSVAHMYQQLQSLVAEFHGESLVVELVARHESLIAYRHSLAQAIETELACFGDTEENRGRLQTEISKVDKASISSRLLIEYAVAKCPSGDKPISMSAYHRLLALGASIFYTAQVSDSVKYQISQHAITLLKSKRIRIEDKDYERIASEFNDRRFDRAIDRGIREKYEVEEGEREAHINAGEMLDEVTKSEFGYSTSEMILFLNSIACSPYTSPGGFGHCRLQELRTHLESETSFNSREINELFELLSLSERDDFLSPPKPFKRSDVEPWKFNRRLSYLRRPILIHGSTVSWGIRSIHQAGEYICHICVEGRLQHVNSDEMNWYKGRATNQVGRIFNDQVYDLLKSNTSLLVRNQVTQLNGKKISRLNGETLGDVDVLAIDAVNNMIFPIETKAFSIAKTASELSNERNELFGKGEDQGKIGLHLERIEWLRSNLQHLLEEFGLESTNDWEIVPVCVLDVDLLSAHLTKPPLKIAVVDDLLEWMENSNINA
jgi:hypothetical protein